MCSVFGRVGVLRFAGIVVVVVFALFGCAMGGRLRLLRNLAMLWVRFVICLVLVWLGLRVNTRLQLPIAALYFEVPTTTVLSGLVVLVVRKVWTVVCVAVTVRFLPFTRRASVL